MQALLSNQRRRFALRVLVPALAALPFAASLGFNSVERKGKAPTPVEERPALVFDQYFVNLEEVRNSPRADAHFCFKNCGKTTARITHLEPSCGCLNPRLEKRAYQPGEICDFTLGVLTTRERPGPHEYELRIDYEDPKPRSVTVAFKFNLRREVTVRPSQLLVYQNGVEETHQKVVVTDMREKPFRITGATCKSPLVKIEIGQPVDNPEGGRETVVSLTVAAKVPENEVQTWVMLTTDDPHYARIPIALLIRNSAAPPAVTRETSPKAAGAAPQAAVR